MIYKGQLAWSFNYSCKSWLLVSGTQWLPCHICESDGKNIMSICKSNGKKHCVHFLHVTSAESWKSWKRHICRVMEKCHVMSCSFSYTSHLQSHGKMKQQSVKFVISYRGKMKSHLWTNWSGMKSLYLCLCLYYYLYLYF